jgi:hypothetical protein
MAGEVDGDGDAETLGQRLDAEPRRQNLVRQPHHRLVQPGIADIEAVLQQFRCQNIIDSGQRLESRRLIAAAHEADRAAGGA